jgi:hypothetical protein
VEARKIMRKNIIVLSIIGLFIGASIIPLIGGNKIESYFVKYDDNEIESLDLSDGLVGHWNFDGGIGDIVYDTVGSNHGEISGATWIYDSICGNAISFDGDWDYVLVQDDDSLNFDDTNEFTLEVWIKWHGKLTPGRGQYIIHKLYYGGYELKIIDDGRVGFNFGYYDEYKNINSNTHLDTNWHHIIAIWDGDTQSLYIDGILENTSKYENYLIEDTNKPLEFGNNWGYSDNENTFNGIIDEITIYERALSSEELYERFNKPYIWIEEPNESDNLKGTINISGKAIDIYGTIEQVEVKIDNGPWIIADGNEDWSYEWDTTTVEDGQHIIYARSFDNDGFSSGIYSVNIIVNNLGDPPIVGILVPEEVHSYSGILEVEGICHDPDGDETIDKIMISIDNDSEDADWIIVDGIIEWSYDLNTEVLTEDWHTLYAKAIDDKGLIGWAVPRIFRVDNTPPTYSIIAKPREGFLYFRNKEIIFVGTTVIIGLRTGIEILVEVDRDEKADIKRVEFWVDDDIKGIGIWDPYDQYYKCDWDEPRWGGPYTIKIDIYDNAENCLTKKLDVSYFNF